LSSVLGKFSKNFLCGFPLKKPELKEIIGEPTPELSSSGVPFLFKE